MLQEDWLDHRELTSLAPSKRSRDSSAEEEEFHTFSEDEGLNPDPLSFQRPF